MEWKLLVALLLGFAGVGAGFVIGNHNNGSSSVIVVTTTFEGHTLEQTVTAVQTETRTVRHTRTVTATIKTSAAVYVPQPAGNLSYRPRLIGLGASHVVRRILWQTYGGAVASGLGLRSNPACTATCPSGQSKWLHVAVELSSLGVCRGVFVYRHLLLDGALRDITPSGCG